MQPHITDFEIYQIFKNNKCILLLLLEQELIQPDTRIITDIMTKHDHNHFPYRHYLYPVIKSFLNEKESEAIEKEIIRKYNQDLSLFEKKCREGENDSYICSLIRQDLAEEFISYVNRANTSLSCKVQPSFFETNAFLVKRSPTLIEYAAFLDQFR